MTSSISWLDADEGASDQARRLIAATTEADGGTLDQLGLGAIRDFCSDQLFPGTSTLWSRARYLILVPWCYHGADPAEAQRKLRKALIAGNDGVRTAAPEPGIIGAQKDVDRLPDEVIWNGLAVWGIRLAEVSRPAAARAWIQAKNAYEDGGLPPTWHPRLPERPPDFPKGQQIRLEPAEARFLAELLTDPVLERRDRYGRRRHASRLPLMLGESLDYGRWDWRNVPPTASRELDQHVRDAACFADLAWSARALYALMVAERAEVELDSYRERLEDAERRVRGAAGQGIRAWDLDRFTRQVLSNRPRARWSLQFLHQWRDLVLGMATALEASEDARKRIVQREVRVKPGRARLTGDQPDAVAVPWPYDFRAGVARSIVADIQGALA